MKRKLWSFIIGLSAALPVSAIELSTFINDVYHLGQHELTGGITMRVRGDEFTRATPDEPTFIRLRFTNNVVLSETRVDQTSSNSAINQPILLAMLTSPNPAVVLTAPADTISIVRWIGGEGEMWIRVQQNSDTWLTENGVPVPPTSNRLVSWSLGITARTSYYQLENTDPQYRNLPFNTRNETTTGSLDEAVSTAFCMDFAAGGLDVDELLEYDAIAFDHTAEIQPGVFQPGNILIINFTNDFRLARGKDRLCTIFNLAGVNANPVSAPEEAPFSIVDSEIGFVLDCERVADYLPTPLRDGCWLMLETDPSKGVGFKPGFQSYVSSDLLVTNPGIEMVDPDSEFTYNGNTLYSRVFLYWDSGTANTNYFKVNVASRVFFPLTNPVEAPEIHWSWHLTNWEQAEDEPPFDGPDQHAFCQPSAFDAGSGSLTLALSIPTLGQWGLILFCALLAGSGMWMMRRRRPA